MSQSDGGSKRRGTRGCCCGCCCKCESHRSQEISTRLPKRPVIVTCPNCRSAQYTRVTRVNTKLVHLFAFLLLPCCLCCLPYCIPTCKRYRHSCRVCKSYIGVSPICERRTSR